eukprot:10116711-Prorocentrum_lima.AAC.1
MGPYAEYHVRVPIVGREAWPKELERAVMFDQGEESTFKTYYHATPFYFLGSILSTGILLPAGSPIDNDYSG